MEYNYTKQEYLEGFEKTREMTLGAIEMATIVSDEEYIKRMNRKLESLKILEELMEEDYNNEEFIDACNKIIYIALDTEINSRFFFLLMDTSSLCKNIIKSYSLNLITREEYNVMVLLDNELEKMILNGRENRLFSRGKFDYIHDYTKILTDRISKRQDI